VHPIYALGAQFARAALLPTSLQGSIVVIPLLFNEPSKSNGCGCGGIWRNLLGMMVFYSKQPIFDGIVHSRRVDNPSLSPFPDSSDGASDCGGRHAPRRDEVHALFRLHGLLDYIDMLADKSGLSIHTGCAWVLA
jgi:hypothetical protein